MTRFSSTRILHVVITYIIDEMDNKHYNLTTVNIVGNVFVSSD